MTPKQIKRATLKELLVVFKNKGRCFYCNSLPIWNELISRLGTEKLKFLQTAHSHLQLGEGDAEFNEECDKLINQTINENEK